MLDQHRDQPLGQHRLEPPATHHFSMSTAHIIALYLVRSIQQHFEWHDSQNFPWGSTTLKIPATHKEPDCSSVTDSLLREGFCLQQICPKWAQEENQTLQGQRFSPWQERVILSEAGTKLQGTKLHPGPRRLPWSGAGSPLPRHPLFPNLLIRFVPLLISCFKNKKFPNNRNTEMNSC